MFNPRDDRSINQSYISHYIRLCRNTVVFLSLLAYYNSRAHSNHLACHLLSLIYTITYNRIHGMLVLTAHGRNTEILGEGGRGRCTSVFSFEASTCTSNICPNGSMTLIPLGKWWWQNGPSNIASLGRREQPSGPSSPLLRGHDIWEDERRAEGGEQFRGGSSFPL